MGRGLKATHTPLLSRILIVETTEEMLGFTLKAFSYDLHGLSLTSTQTTSRHLGIDEAEHVYENLFLNSVVFAGC